MNGFFPILLNLSVNFLSGIRGFWNVNLVMSQMFTRWNTLYTNKNVTLFTVEFALFGGVFPTLQIMSCQGLSKRHYIMVRRVIREMVFHTIFTQMYMTNWTMQESLRSFAYGAAYNIMCTVPGVHSRYLLRLVVDYSIEKKFCWYVFTLKYMKTDSVLHMICNNFDSWYLSVITSLTGNNQTRNLPIIF